MGLLREFRWPYRWLALWGLMLAAVIATSLLPARDLPSAPFSGFDKVEHLLAYAVLSAYAVMLFARRAHTGAGGRGPDRPGRSGWNWPRRR